MSCKKCHLKRACKHMGGLCPWILYAFLLAMVSIPAIIMLNT
jgi:hypothetical protein